MSEIETSIVIHNLIGIAGVVLLFVMAALLLTAIVWLWREMLRP